MMQVPSYRLFKEKILSRLPITGGAMTGYLSDPDTGQVRNLTIGAKKPDDSVGMDGDVWVTPGDLDISGKADKSTVDAIGVTNSIGGTPEAPTLTTTVNGKSSTVNLPAGGGGGGVQKIPFNDGAEFSSKTRVGDWVYAEIKTKDKNSAKVMMYTYSHNITPDGPFLECICSGKVQTIRSGMMQINVPVEYDDQGDVRSIIYYTNTGIETSSVSSIKGTIYRM